MAIKLGGNTNITLTNTSFVGDVYPGKKSVPLFTAASNGTYYFEGDIQDSGTIAVSLNINSTPKEIWTYYDSVSHHVSYEFTLVTGDVVEIEVSGYGTGSNLTVTRYADKPKEIYVGEGIDSYEAMRGPCPEGFHVMRTQDFTGLKTIMESLSLTISDWSAKLKIPLSGDYGAGGSRYWLGERRGFKACDNANKYGAYIYGSKYPDGASTNRKSAHPIRPFKDKYETPTSSRTVIEGTLGSAGIFRDETNGLISITDGTNGYTITDKNLGATVVFNSGDSESANNVGNYYQWGNNYGFSYGRSESTSSSQVDASQYGPGNYYSDNTFRTGANPAYWDSSINTNLRGGETGITKKGNVTEVYVGTTKVWPELYEVSYNLRGGSLNGWIDAGGDTITTNTSYGFDSNGMYITGSGTDKYFALFAELPDLTNAKKITVSFSAYFISGSWSNNKRLGISSINNRDYTSGDFLMLSLAYNSSSPSRYNGAGLSNVVNNSEQRLQKEAVGYATGDVVATLEIDLTTGGLVGTITGANTKNYSAALSSSQLEAIKAYKYVFYEKEEGYQFRNERLKDVYFKVEY